MASAQPYINNNGSHQDIKLPASSIELSDGTTVQDAVESLDQYAKKTDIPQSTNVSFTRNLSSGTKIGTLTIDGTSTDLYSTNNTTYSNATTSSSGLMSYSDKRKLDSINIDSAGHITSSKTGVFGFKIDDADKDPVNRVEYIYDAQGMAPCLYDFTNESMDYGDWGDVWFVKNNKPCMLKSNGTVGYYLNPNDYSLKEDGSASDVGSFTYDGNAMSSIPLTYVKRYQKGRYKYVLLCQNKYDSDFKAYAHTSANGAIKSYSYVGIYIGNYSDTRLRSISGQTDKTSFTLAKFKTAAEANGSNWTLISWSQLNLLRDMMVMISKSTQTQDSFGWGNIRGEGSTANLKSGTADTKGQFYGDAVNSKAVKVFHIENIWGNRCQKLLGFILNDYRAYVKMTPEGSGYQVDNITGYTDTGIDVPTTAAKYIKNMNYSEYGIIPISVGGTYDTYYCDLFNVASGMRIFEYSATVGSSSSYYDGGFYSRIYDAPTQSDGNHSSRLAYV